MKRYIRTKSDNHKKEGITIDSYGVRVEDAHSDKIDVIVVVNDARKQNLKNLPIKAATGDFEDYDSYSIEELMDLDNSILRQIDSFYALDNLRTAIEEYGLDYTLTKDQKAKLSDYYKKRDLSQVIPSDEQIQEILDHIKKCQHITGPDYRPNQPEKNFAERHGLEMTSSDYMAIIKDLKASEFISAVKSADTRRLGAVLYEFIHDPNGYILKYSKQKIEEDIKILPDYENNLTIAIISFHDPED